MLASHGTHPMEAPFSLKPDREELGTPVEIGDLSITPVARVSISRIELAGSVLVFGTKTAVAVIVRSGGREWRVDLPDRDEGPAT